MDHRCCRGRAHLRGHLMALPDISRASYREAARSRVIRAPGGALGAGAPWSQPALRNIGPVVFVCGPMFHRAGGGTARRRAGLGTEGLTGLIRSWRSWGAGSWSGQDSPPEGVPRRDHGQREPSRLVVASIVSRRAGRTFSHLACGTGAHRMGHGARILRGLAGGAVAAGRGDAGCAPCRIPSAVTWPELSDFVGRSGFDGGSGLPECTGTSR